jgi:CO dehydrogenase/acetyl-CoA synthase beta subunit
MGWIRKNKIPKDKGYDKIKTVTDEEEQELMKKMKKEILKPVKPKQIIREEEMDDDEDYNDDEEEEEYEEEQSVKQSSKKAEVTNVAVQTGPAIRLPNGNIVDIYGALAYIINKVE